MIVINQLFFENEKVPIKVLVFAKTILVVAAVSATCNFHIMASGLSYVPVNSFLDNV